MFAGMSDETIIALDVDQTLIFGDPDGRTDSEGKLKTSYNDNLIDALVESGFKKVMINSSMNAEDVPERMKLIVHLNKKGLEVVYVGTPADYGANINPADLAALPPRASSEVLAQKPFFQNLVQDPKKNVPPLGGPFNDLSKKITVTNPKPSPKDCAIWQAQKNISHTVMTNFHEQGFDCGTEKGLIFHQFLAHKPPGIKRVIFFDDAKPHLEATTKVNEQAPTDKKVQFTGIHVGLSEKNGLKIADDKKYYKEKIKAAFSLEEQESAEKAFQTKQINNLTAYINSDNLINDTQTAVENYTRLEKQAKDINFHASKLTNDIRVTEQKRNFVTASLFGSLTPGQLLLLKISSSKIKLYQGIIENFEGDVGRTEREWRRTQNLLDYGIDSSNDLSGDPSFSKITDANMDEAFQNNSAEANNIKNTWKDSLLVQRNKQLENKLEQNKKQLKQFKNQFDTFKAWIYENKESIIEEDINSIGKEFINQQNVFNDFARRYEQQTKDNDLHEKILTLTSAIQQTINKLKQYQQELSDMRTHANAHGKPTKNIGALQREIEKVLKGYTHLAEELETLREQVRDQNVAQSQQQKHAQENQLRTFQPELKISVNNDSSLYKPATPLAQNSSTLTIQPLQSNPVNGAQSSNSPFASHRPNVTRSFKSRERSNALRGDELQLNQYIAGTAHSETYNVRPDSISTNPSFSKLSHTDTKKTIAGMALEATKKFASQPHLVVSGPKPEDVQRAAADLRALGVIAVDTRGKEIAINGGRLTKHAAKQYQGPGRPEYKPTFVEQAKTALRLSISH